jgi:GTPase
MENITQKVEKCILIGINEPGEITREIEYDWTEFSELARAAGAEEVGKVAQARANPDHALFIGTGKAEELAQLVRQTSANLVISLQELSPVQVRNLEDITGVRVIDRTNLILDIFADRAQTREGKLQVELAQLNYLLPRIGDSGIHFSRLGGGIGTRGPGETKLEVDRRRVKKKISDLRRELAEVETHRKVQRHQREKNGIPTIAMVGYTNAGKSTLFNRLAESTVSAEGRLFDTLDPVSRQVVLPNHKQVIMLDTVGFINHLPHQLVAAFKATLEETVRATICLHVMDAAAPNLPQQFAAVRAVLEQLKIQTKDTINVLNKIDLIGPDISIPRLAREWSAVPISAMLGEGLEELVAQIQKNLSLNVRVYQMLLPFSEAGLLDLLHRRSLVLEEVYTGEGVKLKVEMDVSLAEKYQRFMQEVF